MKIFFLTGLFIVVAIILGRTIKTDVNLQISDKTMKVVSVDPPSEFIWAGKLLSDPSLRDQQGRLVSTARKYVEALAKFPDLRSCLKAPPPKPHALDVLTLNWSNIRTVYEFDMCVFHVSNALHDIDRLVEWLDVSGFHVVSNVSALSDKRSVNARWDLKANQSNSPFPRSTFLDWFERMLGVGKFITTIHLDQSNKVLSIQSGFIYK